MNYLIIIMALWFLCGILSVILMLRDLKSRDCRVTTEDILVLIVFFIFGIFGFLVVASNFYEEYIFSFFDFIDGIRKKLKDTIEMKK